VDFNVTSPTGRNKFNNDYPDENPLLNIEDGNIKIKNTAPSPNILNSFQNSKFFSTLNQEFQEDFNLD